MPLYHCAHSSDYVLEQVTQSSVRTRQIIQPVTADSHSEIMIDPPF